MTNLFFIQKYQSKRVVIELVVGLLLALAAVVINLRMIRDGLNGMTDLKWHVTWLQPDFSRDLFFKRSLSKPLIFSGLFSPD
jgi:hypothetical protein